MSSNLPGALEKKLSELEQAGIEEAAKGIAKQNGLPYLKVNANTIDLSVLALLDETDSRTFQVAAVARDQKKLQIVLTDPTAPGTKTVLERLFAQGFNLHLYIVSPLSLQRVWERYHEVPLPETGLLGTVAVDEETIAKVQEEIKNIADLKDKLISLPVTQLLEVLVAGAIKIGASDIHLEPEEKTIRTRYRLDGILSDVLAMPSESYSKLLSRIKITSGLKINIRNAPQDGRFTVNYARKMIEIRTSILPGAYGENVVMRILDPESIKQKIEDLGLSSANAALLKKLLQKTTGAILTTGPTGSGKTTTLYAFIQHINEPGLKIITIEDPVEYHVAGIAQTQVNPAKGYTFASGLRSIVRQDPDVILVGEIRDGETAEIAMQAALTGHLVFSTLHTNDAAGAIPRLMDLGAKPTSVAPALNAVIAQRLVRRLCPTCRQKKTLSPEDYAIMKETFEKMLPKPPPLSTTTSVYYPDQCAQCNFTGYKGRLGVFEFFVLDPEIEQLILQSPAISEMRALAVNKGMVTMRQDGFLKVLAGETSLEEVRRILD